MSLLKRLTAGMTHQQKSMFSLALAILIFGAVSLLAGCSDKADQNAKKADATKQVLSQGTGTIRKAGQSGFKQY